MTTSVTSTAGSGPGPARPAVAAAGASGPRDRGIAVEARDVLLAYGTRTALSGATFSLPVGRSVALIGPNGSGKSTLSARP